jgi:hypothetical protein
MTNIERQETYLENYLLIGNPSALFVPAAGLAIQEKFAGITARKKDRQQACTWDCMNLIMRDFV